MQGILILLGPLCALVLLCHTSLAPRYNYYIITGIYIYRGRRQSRVRNGNRDYTLSFRHTSVFAIIVTDRKHYKQGEAVLETIAMVELATGIYSRPW